MDVVFNLSAALVNLTAAGVAASVNGTGLPIMGCSSSMFDIMQDGNAGSSYAAYERALLGAPGVIATLAATTFHPYTVGMVPWNDEPWGNISFFFVNETAPGHNSTAAAVHVMVALMRAAAAAAGVAPYTPAVHPSEVGYNLQLNATAGGGWAAMHGSLTAQLLVHMRSAPLAEFVRKVFVFAAYDGCCVGAQRGVGELVCHPLPVSTPHALHPPTNPSESGGYFGLWRPAMRRSAQDAASDWGRPTNVPGVVPLPAAAAYSTAAALVDVPAGRLPGVFVVDHTASGAPMSAGGVHPPTCVAFEPDDSAAGPRAQPLAVLFIVAHHFNDRTPAVASVWTAAAPSMVLLNGYGTPLPFNTSRAASNDAAFSVHLTLAALPQYLLLPHDTNATAVCASLVW